MATFNRKSMMQAAHFTAKWRVATVGGAYRGWFAKALAYEWRKAKAAIAREESNVGLPIRSCIADAPAKRSFRVSVDARPIGARIMRFGPARLFAGPNAHATAIDDVARRVGGGFQQARDGGRRASDWA